MYETDPSSDDVATTKMSPWRLAGWLCAGVIAASVIACVLLAVVRSTGLVKVTVTALDKSAEPRDHNIPLFKQKEALPDYEVTILRTDGDEIHLGSKPDTSASDGLDWHVSDPVSLSDIAAIRLSEKDKVLSDAVAEVQITGATTTSNGYQFDFTSQRSFSVGVKSFFGTPIGMAIAAGFCIAVLLLVFSAFAV